jgi:hypothetical protein
LNYLCRSTIHHGLGASVAMRVWHEWREHQHGGQRDGKPLLLREVRLLFHKPSPVVVGRAGRSTRSRGAQENGIAFAARKAKRALMFIIIFLLFAQREFALGRFTAWCQFTLTEGKVFFSEEK